MTLKELSQLYYLNNEIQKDEERLKELENFATGTTSTISGLPHLNGISNKTAIAAEIADLKNLISAKKKQAVAEYNRLMRYITSIDDSIIRQIMERRFIDGYSWSQTRNAINGSNTIDSLKQMLYRYLKLH